MTQRPLLLIPGLNCTAALWRDQVAALGAGRTVSVADHGRGSDLGTIAEAILAEAPPVFALAGLSMGGYVAFEILRRAPERVERLALLDTQAGPDGEEARVARLQQIEIARKGGFARIPDLQIPKLIAAANRDDPRLPEIVRAMAAATGADAYIRQQTAILNRPDSRPDLGRIACPTLVLVGAEDAITPPSAARVMHDGIAGSRLVVVPDCGHLSTIEAPDAVTAALRVWLDV